MKIADLKRKKLPDAPGVYFFLGPQKSILYIGKTVSIKERVKSYFGGAIVMSRSPLIAEMVEKAKAIDFEKTDSVLEALILEANLIKKHKPHYNTRDKDDKSFNYVVITSEKWPRVLVVRGKELYQKFKKAEIKYLFGPFPQGSLFKEAMKIIRKIFPFYDTKKPLLKNTAKGAKGDIKLVEFNQQIGLYPNAETTKGEYARTISHLRLFFEGKKTKLVRQLEREMREYAKKREFEKAQVIKRRLFALKHIRDVSLVKEEFRSPAARFARKSLRIESFDIAHMAGRDTVGVMVVMEDGNAKKSDYRKFTIKKEGINDTEGLKEIISRRLLHSEWELPKLIVVDGGVAQRNTALKTLKEAGIHIPVVSVVKDEKHRPREILGDKKFRTNYEKEILIANSEAHRFAIAFHRRKRRRI